MNIFFRFIILLIKFIVDLIGDIFYHFLHIDLYPLTPTSVLASATAAQQSEIHHNQHLRENLDMMTKHISLKNMTPISGKFFTKYWLLNFLENRVRINEYLREVDGKKDINYSMVELKRPVFFVTLMRTGSTFLHTLMALDDGDVWKCPKLWELDDCSPHGRCKREDMKSVLNCSRKWNFSKILMGWNEISKTHNFDANMPEDLAFLLHLDFKFTSSAVINAGMEGEFTTYFRHETVDRELSYMRNLKKHLQIICKYSKNMEGRRLLTMMHTSTVHLKSLLAVFPDAQVIMLHREPVALVRSACGLVHANAGPLRRVFCAFNDDRHGTGRRTLNAVKLDAEKMVEWRKSGDFEFRRKDNDDEEAEAEDDCQFQRFIDVQFNDLIANPIRTVENIYKQLNVELKHTTIERMQLYLESEKSKRNNNSIKYNLDDFCLSEEYVRNSLKFYTDYFKVHETINNPIHAAAAGSNNTT